MSIRIKVEHIVECDGIGCSNFLDWGEHHPCIADIREFDWLHVYDKGFDKHYCGKCKAKYDTKGIREVLR